jgi:hypothetical protein
MTTAVKKDKNFWEVHKTAEFPRITIFELAPRDARFLEFLKLQNNLTDNEKSVLFKHRVIHYKEISVKELTRLGFLGTEFLKTENKNLNTERLVIQGIQTKEDVSVFFYNFYQRILELLSSKEEEDDELEECIPYFEIEKALEAISLFSRFDLKVERPKSWKKMVALIDDGELIQEMRKLVE